MTSAENGRAGAGRPPDGDSIGALIRRAGQRSTAADYGLGAFKLEAQAHWERVVARRRNRRRARIAATTALALAATLGATAVGLRLLSPAAQPSVGVVEVVSQLLESGPARAAESLAPGAPIRLRAPLRTGGAGLAAVRLDNGIRVRLDRGTEVRLAAVNRLELTRGAVYVDAGEAPAAEYLEVVTPLGAARDVGTLFQVRQDAAQMVVQVREGRVAVRRGDSRHLADAGQEVRLGADGSVATGSIELAGPSWQWVLGAAPTFELEAATLGDYLDWLRRETGWRVRFDGVEREALRQVVLHGSLEGVAPDATLDLVLPGCGLSYVVERGALVLRPETD